MILKENLGDAELSVVLCVFPHMSRENWGYKVQRKDERSTNKQGAAEIEGEKKRERVGEDGRNEPTERRGPVQCNTVRAGTDTQSSAFRRLPWKPHSSLCLHPHRLTASLALPPSVFPSLFLITVPYAVICVHQYNNTRNTRPKLQYVWT